MTTSALPPFLFLLTKTNVLPPTFPISRSFPINGRSFHYPSSPSLQTHYLCGNRCWSSPWTFPILDSFAVLDHVLFTIESFLSLPQVPILLSVKIELQQFVMQKQPKPPPKLSFSSPEHKLAYQQACMASFSIPFNPVSISPPFKNLFGRFLPGTK